MSSILTNQSAIVALQTLKSINTSLTKTQNEISTGKSVSDAKENAAIWAISKTMESDVEVYKTIQKSLNVAGAVVNTALQGGETIVGLLSDMKKLAMTAAGLSETADIAKVWLDVKAKQDQITSVVNASQMNGINLLKASGAVSVLASATKTGTAYSEKIEVSATGLPDISGLLEFTSAAGALTAAATIDTELAKAVTMVAEFGAAGKRINDQSNFVGKLADTLKIGVGTLVDADIEEASARLQALQTQQQLGIQSLSIANQAPSAILALFR